MKRVLLEWALFGAVGVSFGLAALWGTSRWVDPTPHHLLVPTTGNVRHDLHLLLDDGDLTLCNQFDVRPSGKVSALVVRRLSPADILRGDRIGSFTTPGVDFRFYRMAPDGYCTLSLKLTLLIPLALSTLGVFLLLGPRLKRVQDQPALTA